MENKYIVKLNKAIKDLENDNKLDTNDISDGSHTFEELYYHRMILFSIICEMFKESAWKSKLHEDGTMFDNYFIVGISTPEGDYSYHYSMEYWNTFNVIELVTAPEYDGHQPDDIDRLLSLLKN